MEDTSISLVEGFRYTENKINLKEDVWSFALGLDPVAAPRE